MKASFEFTLPEDAEAFETHCKAGEMREALWEFREWLRGARKHRETPPGIEEIWDEFHQILSFRGVEIA